MCDKAVDDCLGALKFFPDWFVTSKKMQLIIYSILMKTLVIPQNAVDNILHFNEDPCNPTFSCNEMGILNIDLNNINLDDTNYDEGDPEIIIHIRLPAYHIKSE